MHALARTALLVALACACQTSQMHTPDGGDDHHDANEGPAGLSVLFSIQPQIPGPVKDYMQVDEVTFKLQSLRVAGDAA